MTVPPRAQASAPSLHHTDLRSYPVTAGFVLMFLFTWPLELGLAAQSRGLLPFHFPPFLELFVGYGFIIASISAAAMIDGRKGVKTLIARLAIWRVSLGWYATALLGPALFYLAGIGIHVMLGGATPDFTQPFVRQLVPPSFSLGLAGIIFLIFQIFVNGEEFGWRGYALPRLQVRYSSLVASLIVGTVASLWHIPKYLTVGDPHVLPFWFFFLHITTSAILFTWIFNKTNGSLLIAILLHAGINTGIVMLPVMPALINDTRPLIISYGLQIIAAGVVAMVAGKDLGSKSSSRYREEHI